MIVMRAGAKQTPIGPPVFSPDGRTLAAPGGVRGVFLWDTFAEGATAEGVPLHGGAEASLALFTPDGKTLFAGHESLHAVDVPSRQAVGIPIGEAYELALAVSPDGTRLVAAVRDIGSETELTCWRVGSYRRPLWRQRVLAGLGLALAFTPDGGRFLMGDLIRQRDGRLLHFCMVTRDLATGAVLATGPPLPDYPAFWVPSPDGAVLVGRTRDRLHIYPQEGQGAQPREVRNDAKKHFTGLAFHPGGRVLAAACNEPVVKLYDTASWTLTRTLTFDIGKIHSVTFSPDGTLGSASSDAGKVVLWDAKDVPGTSTATGRSTCQH